MIDSLFEIVVSASATVAAVSAVGIYRRVDQLVLMTEKHDRTLYGVDDVDGWEGLVTQVASHESQLDEYRDESEDNIEHSE